MNRIRTGSGGAARAVVAAAAVAVLAGCGTGAAPPSGPPSPTPAAPSVTQPPTTEPTAPSTTTAVPVTPVTSPAPGSGSAADRAAVEAVFRAYLRAVAAGDFTTACGLNAPETTQRLLDELARRGTPATTCEDAIAALYSGSAFAQGAPAIADTLEVRGIDVDGDTATVSWSVEVTGRRPVVTNALRRVDGQWRLLPTPDPAG
jgi:ketosteroid isomerase-like protein